MIRFNTSLQNPNFLLFCIFLFLPCLLHASTTTFTFNGFDGNAEKQISCFQGASFVDNTIQLTATDAIQGTGRCLFSLPVHFLNASGTLVSFSTQFIFSINPGPQGNADGITFVIAPALSGVNNSSQGLLGAFNNETNGNASIHTLAIEFDTYKNPEYKDQDDNHVGVDVNSIVSLVAASGAYRTSSSPTIESLADGYTVQMKGANIQAWIDYDANTNQLNISVSRVLGRKPSYPLISNSSLNLSSLFLEKMYVGFTAATGPLEDVFYFVSAWSFSNNGSSADVFLPTGGGGDRKKKIVLGVVCSTLGLLLVAGLVYAYIWKRKQNKAMQLSKDKWEVSLVEHLPQKFSYGELVKATHNFSEKNLLGSGGFGAVYHGIIRSSGVAVAVKRISKESKQGVKEFVTEVTTIGRLRHRNLVPLLGWCQDKGFMLVYELMPSGSLDKLLFDNQEKLSWNQRIHILRGVAAALLYLHEECEQKIVHRDIKASNVMIDGQMNARLGDFGLARLYGHDAAPNTTNVAGTWGYMAPESFFTRRATEKTDVFSFGALTLEVATGKRMSEPGETEGSSMIEWLWKLQKNETLEEALDPIVLGDSQEDNNMGKVVLELGLLCCYPDPEGRPSMRRIVQVLGGDALPPALPSVASSPFLFSSLALSTALQDSTTVSARSMLEDSSSRLFNYPLSASVEALGSR